MRETNQPQRKKERKQRGEKKKVRHDMMLLTAVERIWLSAKSSAIPEHIPVVPILDTPACLVSTEVRRYLRLSSNVWKKKKSKLN